MSFSAAPRSQHLEEVSVFRILEAAKQKIAVSMGIIPDTAK